MVTEHTDRRPNIDWLDKELDIKNKPPDVKVRLLGTYDSQTMHTLIYVCVELRGTLYKVLRYNKITNQLSEITIDRLLYLHRNMLNYYNSDYAGTDWSKFKKQFLKWNSNKTVKEILIKEQ